jgi:hypothetical protein
MGMMLTKRSKRVLHHIPSDQGWMYVSFVEVQTHSRVHCQLFTPASEIHPSLPELDPNNRSLDLSALGCTIASKCCSTLISLNYC